MTNIIGIRHEDKYKLERRTPLIPTHVKEFIEKYHIDIRVESSAKRIFTDKEYEDAGAKITKDLKECNLILGVKEMPPDFFEQEKTYMFFSHVIKGQPYNMPMLKKMIEQKCNLIDYEKVTDEQSKRLIFFGRYAGIAGMINSLWSLGLRLKHYGYDTPFLRLKQSHKYSSLEEARNEISEAGREIAEKGLHKDINPLTFGFTGYGNVSQGAQEIIGLLPVKEISPEKLISLEKRGNTPNNLVYKVVFKEKDIVEPKNINSDFELFDYYNNPDKYQSKFEKYVPYLSVLMNCMYWDDKYPRIITKDYLEKLYSEGNPKLAVIGDITCDPDGSVECTHKGTEIEDPIFVYNPLSREPTMGMDGDGVLVMAVDILPSELPKDSSISFSTVLKDYIIELSETDFNKSFDEINLPGPLKRALILHKGELTPDFKYIEKFLK